MEYTETSGIHIRAVIALTADLFFSFKEKAKARRVMQQGQPPRNCREAFTMEGDQVYPNRYYTQDVSTAKYLGGDLEAEIRYEEV